VEREKKEPWQGGEDLGRGGKCKEGEITSLIERKSKF